VQAPGAEPPVPTATVPVVENEEPVIVIKVPPEVGPMDGVTPDTAGAE